MAAAVGGRTEHARPAAAAGGGGDGQRSSLSAIDSPEGGSLGFQRPATAPAIAGPLTSPPPNDGPEDIMFVGNTAVAAATAAVAAPLTVDGAPTVVGSPNIRTNIESSPDCAAVRSSDSSNKEASGGEQGPTMTALLAAQPPDVMLATMLRAKGNLCDW
eukprot:GHVU01070240.1.p1 GENE.GHVU01070240.1~~GHVU01070240.1.p1  ORF type:complete len:159 (+),score=35.53 GHVU01070240.1:238-714(+)